MRSAVKAAAASAPAFALDDRPRDHQCRNTIRHSAATNGEMMSANRNHTAFCSRVTAATPTIIDNVTHEKRMDGVILSPQDRPSSEAPSISEGKRSNGQ